MCKDPLLAIKRVSLPEREIMKKDTVFDDVGCGDVYAEEEGLLRQNQ
jgi:hypothetical protein